MDVYRSACHHSLQAASPPMRRGRQSCKLGEMGEMGEVGETGEMSQISPLCLQLGKESDKA